MNSLILRVAARYLHPLLLLYSVFLLLTGHNDPGGGFTGGLVAATSFALYTIAFGVAGARRAMRIRPLRLAGLGVLTALGSGLIGLALQQPFLTGLWVETPFPIWGSLLMGTPVLFDLGVYLTVLGVSTNLLFAFSEA